MLTIVAHYPNQSVFHMADNMLINISEPEYNSILRQAVAVLPWGHVLKLMQKFKNDDEAILYYAQETIAKGWSRSQGFRASHSTPV